MKILALRNKLPDKVEKSGKCWLFSTKEQVQYSEPIHLGKQLPKAFSDHMTPFTLNQPYVCEIDDVSLVGPRAIGVTPTGKIILECTTKSDDTWAFRNDVKSRASVEYKLVFSLLNSWSHYYYHWIMDCLTSLQSLQYYCQISKEQPLLLVGPQLACDRKYAPGSFQDAVE